MRKELELRLQGEFPFMRTDYPCMPYDFISATDRLGTISKEIIGGHRYNTHGFGGRWYNTYGFCGCDCGDGWYKIIHGLCSDIADAYARQGREVDIVPRYVEEQSGMLWFDYIFGGAGEPPPDTDTSDDGGGVASSADKSGMEDIVGEIVEKWERASESTCQLCGAPAPSVVREKHQWSPLCDACLEKGMQMPEPAWSWSLDEATGALTVSGVGCMFTAEPGNHYLYTGVDCHGAFRDRTHLIKSVVIEDGITAIGCRAFEGCFRLESVSIPDSVTYIGAAAFGDCDALKSVRIPDGVRIICGHAFSGCDSLSDVHIPDGVVAIGNGAFSRCPALTDVRIPEGVRYVGVGAFKGCASLARVTIPATVESIGAGLFKGCHSLKNVGISESNPWFTYRDGALLDKTGGKLLCYLGNLDSDTYAIEDGIVEIGDYAFYGHRDLESVTIPDSVGVFGKSCFEECLKLVIRCSEGSRAHEYVQAMLDQTANADDPRAQRYNEKFGIKLELMVKG